MSIRQNLKLSIIDWKIRKLFSMSLNFVFYYWTVNKLRQMCVIWKRVWKKWVKKSMQKKRWYLKNDLKTWNAKGLKVDVQQVKKKSIKMASSHNNWLVLTLVLGILD